MSIPSRIRRIVLPIGLAIASACLSVTSPAGPPQLVGDGPKVLFIGNSYTYVNDVPGMVQALAVAANTPIAVETVANPDYALVDHWNGGSQARSEIAKGGWKYVVLQQGPSSVDVNRDTLRLAAKLFDADVRKIGGTTALFSAWPTQDRRVDFPRAIESYRIAASDVSGVFLPVAGAWLAAWERDATLPLYASDGLHASAAGSYLTALVIYAKLTGQSPVGSPAQLTLANGGRVTIAPQVASMLQDAATAAIGASP
ncbi:MAG TPA: hypothetical protein VGM82_01815 [Gemmatimonadaceae bacterium]